jgi:hypothetical protein
LVTSGRVNIKDYYKLSKSRDLFQLTTAKQDCISTLEHEWHHGPTGTGKSSSVRRRYPTAFIKLPNKWWDGYRGQDVVIIDDIGTEHSYLGYHLKIWADHYPFPAEVKGSTISARPTKLIITSNYAPEDIWQDPKILEPIKRRFRIHVYKELVV